VGIGVLVGCQPKAAPSDRPAVNLPNDPAVSTPGRLPENVTPNVEGKAPDGTGGITDAAPRPQDLTSPLNRKPKPGPPPPVPKNVFRIPGAGTEGWQRSRLSALDLGTKLDRAGKELKSAYGEATFWVQNQEMQGHNTAKIRVVDGADYEIEYQMPADPVVTEIVVAGHGKRMMLPNKGAWKLVSAVVPPRNRLLAEWESSFPRAMFGNLSGEAVWSPVLQDLLAGKGGYRAVLEEKSMTVNGRSVLFYRVLAERPGAKSSRIEMRFDGTRFVPLTIKVNRTPAGKKPELVQWNARWAFGQPLPKRQYTTP